MTNHFTTVFFLEFIIHTDHSSLRWHMNVTDPSGSLMQWRLQLREFRFEVRYKKEIINSHAKALSQIIMSG